MNMLVINHSNFLQIYHYINEQFDLFLSANHLQPIFHFHFCFYDTIAHQRDHYSRSLDHSHHIDLYQFQSFHFAMTEYTLNLVY